MRNGLGALGLIGVAALLGCAPSGAKTLEEGDAPLDGAYDSFRSPTDHGSFGFGSVERAELTSAEGFHAWTFSLTASASVSLRTEAAGGGEVDTVLYLYREGSSGWGRYLARNDDTMGSLFSGISRELTAGRYRVLVKGYQRTTRGPFGMVAECSGAGCATPVTECLFGDVFGQLEGSPRVIVSVTATHATADLSSLHASQLVRAMNDAGHPEVRDAEAALALTPEHVAERFEIYDGPGGRAFTAWRFVLGDHYFGAIFERGTTIRVSHIVDDVLDACTVGLETCTLGSRYREFRVGSLSVVSDVVVTSADAITSSQRAQLLRAVQESYAEVRTPAEAIARVDGATVNMVTRRDAVSGRTFVAFEYGAGDNSYGAFFEGSSATPIGVIRDGDIHGCGVFTAPLPPAVAGEDCSRARQCADGMDLRCFGIEEESGVGRCASVREIEGDGLACSATVPCAAGLLCGGLSRAPEGICRPAWMRGTFERTSPVSIPDGDARGISDPVTVYGLATVDTDVSVTVRIDHGRSTDLRIVLLNAAGTEQLVFDGAAEPLRTSPFELTRSVAGSGDESVTGRWSLGVTDSRRGTAGRIDGWSLTVTTRWD